MATIPSYTAITSVEGDDLFVVVDVNDSTMSGAGTTKKMTFSQLQALFAEAPAGTASAGFVPVATGTGEASEWFPGPGLPPSGDTTGATDVTNIQALLNLCSPGKTAQLQAGVFWTDAPIIQPPWVTLQGEGTLLNNSFLTDYPTIHQGSGSFAQGGAAQKAAILMVDQATGGYSIASAGQQVININVDGSSAPSNTDGIDLYGTVGGVLMRDVSVRGMTGGGVQCLSRSGNIPDGLRLNGLMAAGGGGNGFFFQSADMICHDLHSIGNGGDGFRIITAANSHFSDCRSGNNSARGWNFGNNTGSANGTGYLSLQNCNSQLNALDGYYVDWTAANGGHVINATGLTSVGDGENGGSGGGGYAAFNVVSAGSPVTVQNLVVIPGTNNPNYAVSVTSCAYLAIRSGVLQGFATVFSDGGTNGTILIDPGVLTGTGTTSAPSWNTQPAQLSPGALPSDQGLLAWSFDPAMASSTPTALVTETLYLTGIFVRSPMLATNVLLVTTGTAASGITACGVGLYSSAGTLLASNTSATPWGTAGVTTFALGTAQLLTPGLYWVGVFLEATGMPTIRYANAGIAVNTGLSAAHYRFGVYGSGTTTTLPSPLTPASITETALIPFWAALS